MRKTLLTRRRVMGASAAPLAALALSLGFSGAAFAGAPQAPTGGNATSGNYAIFQGGSNTTYLMMQALADVFDQAPGCDLASASGTPQPLNYACPTGSANLSASTSQGVGENGFTPFGNENPFNDLLVEEPALGSSNGIAELEDQGGHGQDTFSNVTVSGTTVTPNSGNLTGIQKGDTITDTGGVIPAGDTISGVTISGGNVTSATLATSATGSDSTDTISTSAPVSVSGLSAARSSRAPNLSTDDKGLNFVAYAMDGVSWFHWSEVDSAATPSAGVTNLTVSQLTQIWSGTLSCTIGSNNYTMNWICLGGSAAPIDVYMAQNGSGTEATWASLLGLTGTFPFGSENTNHVIFENETESIINNGDEADAIFFFSYGKYNTVCHPTLGYCGTAPASFPGTNTLAPLGQINGITVDSNTIAAQLPNSCSTVTDVTVTGGSTTLKATGTGSSIFTSGETGLYVTDSAGAVPGGDAIKKFKAPNKVKMVTAATTSATNDTLMLCAPEFPGDRLLYNVYADGSNPVIPASSDPALNAVSEDGFICKPGTSSDVDPNTGDTYRSEIDSIITAQGFYPLPLEVEDGQGSSTPPYTTTATGIPNPAWNELGGSAYDSSMETGSPYNWPSADTDTDSTAVSGSYTGVLGYPATTPVTASASAPIGYCLTLTTDGNPNY